jgi:hypothetical protein
MELLVARPARDQDERVHVPPQRRRAQVLDGVGEVLEPDKSHAPRRRDDGRHVVEELDRRALVQVVLRRDHGDLRALGHELARTVEAGGETHGRLDPVVAVVPGVELLLDDVGVLADDQEDDWPVVHGAQRRRRSIANTPGRASHRSVGTQLPYSRRSPPMATIKEPG